MLLFYFILNFKLLLFSLSAALFITSCHSEQTCLMVWQLDASPFLTHILMLWWIQTSNLLLTLCHHSPPPLLLYNKIFYSVELSHYCVCVLPEDVSSLQVEMRSLLKELHCPFEEAVSGILQCTAPSAKDHLKFVCTSSLSFIQSLLEWSVRDLGIKTHVLFQYFWAPSFRLHRSWGAGKPLINTKTRAPFVKSFQQSVKHWSWQSPEGRKHWAVSLKYKTR